MPDFMGTLAQGSPDDPNPTHNRDQLIVLESLTYGFKRPCVIDIKLGRRLWDDDTPEDKQKRLDAVANVTTTGSLGLRIAGMSVWKEEKGEFVAYDKFYGRTFDKDSVIGGIAEFFSSGISCERQQLIARRFEEKIAQIVDVLEREESRMYSMSILAVYEGGVKELEEALKKEEEEAKKPRKDEDEDDDDEEEDDEDDEALSKVEDLRLIDFAHATWTPGKGPDENVLEGVRNARKLFAQFAGSD